LFALTMAAPLVNATVIYTTTDELSLADPTQSGRLSRTGIPSDWSAVKAFPGVLNVGTMYNYREYVINVGLGNYLQFEVDWGLGTNAFAAAYQGSYNPGDLSENYLGDIGASGNSFGNPGFFQVLAAQNSQVILVISSAVSGAGGVGTPFTLTTESFIDTDFTDPPTEEIPEPASMTLMSLGLGGLGLAAWRRRAARG
jgi:hypothetical protein